MGNTPSIISRKRPAGSARHGFHRRARLERIRPQPAATREAYPTKVEGSSPITAHRLLRQPGGFEGFLSVKYSRPAAILPSREL